jgi:NAD(P)-dependent dehydrogenase (short-subunit alcohol dehydrogenase family)
VLDTNLLGTLCLCRAALRHMLPQGRGDILLMGSASAEGAWPYFGVYAASKAAVIALARTLRAEAAPRGVRVMTVDIHNVAGTDFAAGLDPEMLPAAIQLVDRDAELMSADDHRGRRGARRGVPASQPPASASPG